MNRKALTIILIVVGVLALLYFGGSYLYDQFEMK